jgi:two-component system, response regulator PdtaR
MVVDRSPTTSGDTLGSFFAPTLEDLSPMPALTAARKILTVDDNPIVRADLRRILEDAGFEVVPDARDGVEAVDLAREHRPSLVLIDLNLPRLDGVEATRRILDERDVPIVALTGHSSGGYIERAAEAGAVGHVLKPFSEAQLVGTLRGVLADRDERDAAVWEHRSQLIRIESMVREGRSEREITRAVDHTSVPSHPFRWLLRRLRAMMS